MSPRTAETPQEVAAVLWKHGLSRWFRARPGWRLEQPGFGVDWIEFAASSGTQQVRLRVEPRGASPSPLLEGPRLQVSSPDAAAPAVQELARLVVAVDEKGVPLRLGEPRARRLELFIVDGCNQECSFCCEANRVRRRQYMPWEELVERLDAAAADGVELIQFMGGEATLHPRFADALAHARSLSLKTYVITNLLRWERRDFAEAVGPLLDEIMISVHAVGDETGLRVTNRATWWRRFQAAAGNARATLTGRVSCATVLSRDNVDVLDDIADVVASFGAHTWVLGNPVPVLDSRVDPAEHTLTLSEQRALVPRLRALTADLDRRGCRLVSFCIPHCVLGPALWDNTHDEFVDDQDLTDDAPADRESVVFWSKAHDRPVEQASVVLGRRRAAACADCIRRDRCGGYFANYLDAVGEHELAPVHPGDALPSGRTGGPQRDRRFHLFGVGIPKTGTTSLAAIFDQHRWGHEVWFDDAILALDRAAMDGSTDLVEVLSLRDRATRLECDSASFHHFWMELLVDRYPDARFVLTVREPVAWLQSLLSMWLRNDVMNAGGTWPAWQRALGRLMLGDAFDVADYSGPAALAAGAPRIVDAGLRFWADQNRRVLDLLPPGRSLVVRTEQLGDALPALAALAGVPVETLHPAHENRGRGDVDLAALIGADALSDKVEQICGPVRQSVAAICHAPQ